jgi:hypothetical protein
MTLPEGKTLRSYLAEKLQCDPMRITKKYAGAACLGKRIHHLCESPRFTSQEISMAKVEIERLEERFRLRLALGEGATLPPMHSAPVIHGNTGGAENTSDLVGSNNFASQQPQTEYMPHLEQLNPSIMNMRNGPSSLGQQPQAAPSNNPASALLGSLGNNPQLAASLANNPNLFMLMKSLTQSNAAPSQLQAPSAPPTHPQALPAPPANMNMQLQQMLQQANFPGLTSPPIISQPQMQSAGQQHGNQPSLSNMGLQQFLSSNQNLQASAPMQMLAPPPTGFK